MTEQKKTHWKKLINPAYIGAYSLEPGQDKTVTIDKVVREMVTSAGGKKEECSVAYLRGEKPFILNATNSKSIANLYGVYIEDWAGKSITLFAATTRLAGETVECLRIRTVVPEKVKPLISNERFQAGLESIAKGSYTSDRMRSSFSLTEAQNSALDAHIKLLTTGEIDGTLQTEYEGTIQGTGQSVASNNDGTEEKDGDSEPGG